jgi:hypothetical protein
MNGYGCRGFYEVILWNIKEEKMRRKENKRREERKRIREGKRGRE